MPKSRKDFGFLMFKKELRKNATSLEGLSERRDRICVHAMNPLNKVIRELAVVTPGIIEEEDKEAIQCTSAWYVLSKQGGVYVVNRGGEREFGKYRMQTQIIYSEILGCPTEIERKFEGFYKKPACRKQSGLTSNDVTRLLGENLMSFLEGLNL